MVWELVKWAGAASTFTIMEMHFNFDEFDPNNPPEGMPPEMVKKVTEAKEAQKWALDGKSKVVAAAAAQEAILEKEVFMRYWQHLGNHADSYQTSFAQAARFWGILRFIRKTLKRMDHGERMLLLQTLGETLASMADIYGACQQIKQEHDANAPKAIAKLLRERELGD